MRGRAADTHWLTHASLVPAPRQPRWLQPRKSGWLALGLLLATVVAGVMGNAFVGVTDTVDTRQQQQALQAEVERLRTELAVEHATRDELERQAAGLNDQVAELTGQLRFLAARSGNGERQAER